MWPCTCRWSPSPHEVETNMSMCFGIVQIILHVRYNHIYLGLTITKYSGELLLMHVSQ